MEFSNIHMLWWLLPIAVVLIGGMFFSLVDRPRFWKWLSFGLRFVGLALLILALCRPFQKGEAEDLQVVFLVDGSYSISEKGMENAIAKIEKMRAHLDDGDESSIVLFAAQTRKLDLKGLREYVDKVKVDGGESSFRGASNISAALLSSRMEFGANTARKIVLLSDGSETDSSLKQSLETLSSEGVTVDFVKLEALKKAEVAVVAFKSLVKTAYEGEIVRFEGEVTTNKDASCLVRLLHRGVEVRKQKIDLRKGQMSQIGFDVEMFTSGRSRWTMEIQSQEDYFPMNNQISTTIHVSGKPRILAIHQKPKELRPLARALRKQGLELDVRGVKGLPQTFEELMAYKAVMLSNVPATELTVPQMRELKRYVSDFGGGLAMLGSENSFGIGGYHATPIDEILPIASRYEKEKIKPSLAMVLVIDKSGSMQGVPISLARQAAKSAVDLLGSLDSIAVVGFDSNAQVIVEMTPASQKTAIKDSIDSLAASGGTNLYPGMVKAKEMLDVTPAKIKHMIILSDGQTSGSGYEELAQELIGSRVTISTVALGEGAAKDLMQALASLGKGRYYETNDPQNVPQIFTKETMQASKSAIKEDLYGSVKVSDHPLMSGFEKADLPFIMGYVMTQARPTAKVVLATELGDPLLAVNRFGLGQTLAYTSDLTEKWGSEWLGWEACGKFWNQGLRSILKKENGTGVQISSKVSGDDLVIQLKRKDEAGNLVNKVKWLAQAYDGAGEELTLKLRQSGVGTYQARLPIKGKKRLTLRFKDAADGNGRTIYWQRPYPTEYQLDAIIAPDLSSRKVDELDDVRGRVERGIVEIDSQALFAFSGLGLAILGIYCRRLGT